MFSTCHWLPHRVRFVMLVSALLTGYAAPHLSAQSPRSPSGTSDHRRIALDGQSNFRDVGGYTTEDGKRVRMGRVFRSGELNNLSDEDLRALQKLKIGTVVNFLTEEEIRKRGKDRLPAGVEELSQPIESDDGLVAAVLQARKTADFSGLSADLNPQFHRLLVEQAKAQYASLFREIIRSDKPLAFHCSHGVHRTGTAAAILLWSLDVPWETVRQDYLLSNRYRRQDVEKRIQQLRQLAAKNQRIAADEVDMTNIRAFYVLKGNYIDATRDQIIEGYNSIDGYLTEGLGLTDDEIRKLRDRLLQ